MYQNLSSEDIGKWAGIKFGLLAEGARLSQSASQVLFDVKQPIRTRSGVSGGLDITIGPEIDVNVPVVEKFVAESSYELDHSEGTFVVTRRGVTLCTFAPHPLPEFYEKSVADGTESMQRIGQMCSRDRFCYGMTGPTCHFWKSDRRCKYCSIAKNFDADAARKQRTHFIEVLAAAINDSRTPARHILIGGGTPTGEDMGAVLAAEYCRDIRSNFGDISIYVMIAAPLKNEYITLLHDSGATELGMNLEFWSDQAWAAYIPGKTAEIGKRRYLEALEFAVSLFGPVNTRSILLAGLESLDDTFDGAIHLAKMGVMPIVSPFRPLDGTMLADSRGRSGEEYVSLWEKLETELIPLGIPLGPACVYCQNNTLALPTDSRYRAY
jgi:hypothetical protein